MAKEATATTTEPVADVAVDTPADVADTALAVDAVTDTPDSPQHWSRNKEFGFDDDTMGWLENKDHKNPQAMVTSNRELEKLMGGPPEMLQKWPESDDKEGFKGIFRRLGTPENVEGYKFEFEEGAQVDKDTLEWFKGVALAHDMTNNQAQGVMTAWNAEVARLQEEQAKTIEVQEQIEQVALENQWGTKCAERLDYGHRAMLALGLKEENIDSIQSAIGPKMLAEFAAKVADTMGEDTIAANTETAAFGTTKQQIQNSINELTNEIGADTDRYNIYYADHKAPKEATGKDFRRMQLLKDQLKNLINAGA